jgi:hypothetical protein
MRRDPYYGEALMICNRYLLTSCPRSHLAFRQALRSGFFLPSLIQAAERTIVHLAPYNQCWQHWGRLHLNQDSTGRTTVTTFTCWC